LSTNANKTIEGEVENLVVLQGPIARGSALNGVVSQLADHQT
jgi:hypothetical protein